jgi:hypothetical protein
VPLSCLPAVQRVMLDVSADGPVECPPSKRRAGGSDVAGPIGEELSMRYMKMAMAIAAVCAAMVSLTMAAMRKREGSKGQRSRS